MNKTIYKYYVEDECYYSVGWSIGNVSSSKWNFLVDVLVEHKYHEYKDFGITINELDKVAYELYEGFTLQELKNVCDRLGIVLEEVEGSY